jgi:hypothetical protein
VHRRDLNLFTLTLTHTHTYSQAFVPRSQWPLATMGHVYLRGGARTAFTILHIHIHNLNLHHQLKTLSFNPFMRSKIPSRQSRDHPSRTSETLSFKLFTHRKIPSLQPQFCQTLLARR